MNPTQHGQMSGHEPMTDDVKILHSMGYAQELSRRMGGFSNFAISFSIICILAGGITAFPNGFTAAGGASIGIGWPVGAAFALIVAIAMGQIASAYPTAGGLYHWGSILGGRFWGWATAWFNLLGLIFVVASVNVGVYFLTTALIGPYIGYVAPEAGTTEAWLHQTIFVVAVTGSQCLFNHFGIRATTLLTDFSGYLIFIIATLLTVTLLVFSPTDVDFSRLFTFTNYTGDAGGGVWPQHDSMFVAFLLGLLLTIYTITGFDASAHTSEETRNAAVAVPKGMYRAVLWSAVFGYVMVCTFVLVMPSLDEGAKQGFNIFFWLFDQSQMPAALKAVLAIGIVLANYLCALAGLTSTSRMIFAFARDGGLPWSTALRHVSKAHRTPVYAIWIGGALSIVATLYAGAFIVLATGCAVFLYISYIMPVAAGLLAEGKTWTQKGPFNLKGLSKPVAVLAVIGGGVLIWVGVQPPNEKVGYLILGLIAALIVLWFAMERKRFQGPPTGEMIAKRQREIMEAERAVGEAGR